MGKALAVEVVFLETVPVDEVQRPDTHTRQHLGYRSPQSAYTDNAGAAFQQDALIGDGKRLRVANVALGQNLMPQRGGFERRPVEAEEIVEIGDLDPDEVHLPGIFVQRIFRARDLVNPIEHRTTRPRPA